MRKNNDNLKLFALSANPKLGKIVAEKLGVTLGNADVSKFADGEIRIDIKDSVRNDNIFIIQSTVEPVNDNLMELLIFVDALRRASAKEINVIIPYYGYSRQERKTRSRQPISAKLVANLIEVAGVDRIMSIDLHSPQIQGFFNIPFDHLTAGIAASKFLKERLKDKKDIIIMSPDFGGIRRARKLAKGLGEEIAIIDKRRPAPGVAEVETIIGNVEGKVAVFIDDIVDTAGTLCTSAQAVKNHGATEVYAFCTHGLLSQDAQDKIDASVLSKVFITNSTETKKITSPKIEVIDISDMIALAVDNCYTGKSMGELFGGN